MNITGGIGKRVKRSIPVAFLVPVLFAVGGLAQHLGLFDTVGGTGTASMAGYQLLLPFIPTIIALIGAVGVFLLAGWAGGFGALVEVVGSSLVATEPSAGILWLVVGALIVVVGRVTR